MKFTNRACPAGLRDVWRRAPHAIRACVVNKCMIYLQKMTCLWDKALIFWAGVVWRSLKELIFDIKVHYMEKNPGVFSEFATEDTGGGGGGGYESIIRGCLLW